MHLIGNPNTAGNVSTRTIPLDPADSLLLPTIEREVQNIFQESKTDCSIAFCASSEEYITAKAFAEVAKRNVKSGIFHLVCAEGSSDTIVLKLVDLINCVYRDSKYVYYRETSREKLFAKGEHFS